jgi:hypothetical protein
MGLFFFIPHHMKHIGSTSYYKQQRERELMTAFRQLLHECSHVNMEKLFKQVVMNPCSRFWVSEERATIVIGRMMRGLPVIVTHCKREMYNEIFTRCKALKSQSPSLSMSQIVCRVVSAPAPKFYLSASQAKAIINNLRRKNKATIQVR